MSTNSSPGCIILLVDESAGMKAIMGDMVADGKASNKTNAERVATAINALLGQLSTGPDFDVALIGYRTNSAGEAEVGSRWGGTLDGREFVSTHELAKAPLKQESRTRRVPTPGGGFREEPVTFSVWYEPTLGAKAPQIAAYNFCVDLLSRWNAGSSPGQPLVLHVFSGASGDGNPQMAVVKLQEVKTAGGSPVVLQVHLAASSSLAPTLYPANAAYLTAGATRDLFRRASVLPDTLSATLREAKVVVNKGARGMLYNAKVGDLIRCLGLIKTFSKNWTSKTPVLSSAPEPIVPAAMSFAQPADTAPATASNVFAPLPDITFEEAAPTSFDNPGVNDSTPAPLGERLGLAVLLLDRSVADPFSGSLDGTCARLQDQANDIIKQLGKLGEIDVDVALVSYGADGSGHCDVRDTFDGPLAGRSTVRNAEIAAGAIRVDEFEEEVSNGMGGLIKFTRKKPIYFDVEPTGAAQPQDGFAAVSRVVGGWIAEHPTACLPPVVLHLTSGECDLTCFEAAVESLRSLNIAAGPVAIYNLALTQEPFKSLSYPDTEAELQGSSLEKVWAGSSPLLDADKIATERPAVAMGARGFVVNGKFDLFVDAFKRRLTADQQLAGVSG